MNIFSLLRSISLSSNRILVQQFRHKTMISYPGGEKKPSFWRRARGSGDRKTVAVIRMSGPIMESRSGPSGQRNVNYANVRPLLERALQMKKLDALALEINSPGGSPVQSDLIYNEIRRVASLKNVPVLSFVEDYGASGGYYIACAGNDILVNTCSFVGSIGAIIATFGLKRFIHRYDIDRRVIKAGKNKMLMDVFSDLEDSQKEKLTKMMTTIHQEFIAVVKESRGDRLKLDSGTPLFEGDIFSAREAVELGLVDGITPSMETALVERYGTGVEVHRLQPKRAGLGALLDGGVSVNDLLALQDGSDLPSLLYRLFIEDALAREQNLPKTKFQ